MIKTLSSQYNFHIMANQPYEQLKDGHTPQDNEYYSKSPRLSDLPSNLIEINLSDNASSPTSPKSPNKIEMKITTPPKQPIDSTPNNITPKPSKFKRRRKSRSPYINMRLKHISKLFDKQSIYFACIAPLRSNYIDLHCKELKDLDLKYCCGLYMKIDKSFTIHTILSTEFITSLKKIILKREQKTQEYINQNKKSIDLQVDQNNNNKNEEKYNPRKYVAFHPRDHWEFAKDMEHKNAVIFIHGQNYAPDEEHAAQFVMNECMAFYADMPYLVIPFIYPCEGELLDYDINIIAEEYCATELATFIRRLWVLFERIDFVGHGKGCNILLRAVKLLQKEKPDVIDMSHLILIAADMDSQIFVEEYIDELYRFVKRITIYVNTWDWKLYSSKIWNWSSDRVGAIIMNQKKFDCIDVTQLLSGWFLTSNHYYLTNKYFKLDIIQALSKIGGVDPQYRNYVLPVYDEQYNINDGLLAAGNHYDNNNNIKYYELVDKPYMKIVPEKKQNVRNI
eukprot:267926_1